MKTEQLLQQLEELVDNSGTLPLTSKRIIEEDEILGQIESLKEMLPIELAESQRIIEQKEQIIDDAKKQAEAMIQQAKTYISQMTTESEMGRQAQEYAAEVINAANKSSEELKNSSITYAADVLKYVENNLEKTLESIKQNRESLSQTRNNQNK